MGDTETTKTLSADPKGFLYLKRDLTRLLGILSYHSKQIQDRVRVCGGLPVVLNMCVVDERNPCECFIEDFFKVSCRVAAAPMDAVRVSLGHSSDFIV